MICHACGKDQRCEATTGSMRCQGEHGHSGPHWVDVGHVTGVNKWGVELSNRCAKWGDCILRPCHKGPCESGSGKRVRVTVERKRADA